MGYKIQSYVKDNRLNHSKIAVIVLSCALIASCSFPLKQKEGSEAILFAYDLKNTDDIDGARAAYQDALLSGRRDIRAEAYSELSRLDRDGGDYESHIANLEEASFLLPEKYNLSLALAYKKYGTPDQKADAKDTFIDMQDMSAMANLALADYAIEDSDAQLTSRYLQSARDLYAMEINNDCDGRDALKIARTYYDYALITPDYNQAEYWYRQSIAKGNEDAAFELGDMWINHQLRDNAKADALKLILQTANHGHEKSIKHVANAYAEGVGTDIDQEKAIEWYEKLAEFDDRKAYDYLAEAYMRQMKRNAKSIPTNVVDAYKNARRLGSEKGALVVALWGKSPKILSTLSDDDLIKDVNRLEKIWNNRQPHLMKKLYLMMADRNITDAVIYVAEGYDGGINGFEKNSEKAIQYYTHAAEFGNADGLLKIAQSYTADPNNKESLAKGFEWYQKTAEAGNGEGQYQTGLMLARGIGVAENLDKAREWLTKATKNGYPLALKILETLDEKND